MIPYDLDPSLHESKPEPEQLGDGFSPPQPEPAIAVVNDAQAEAALSEKSAF